MKPGQRLTRWFQLHVLGGLRAPQDLYRAALDELGEGALASDRFFSIPDDGPSFDAPARLKAVRFMHTDAFLAQWGRADWQHVDQRLMRWSALTIELARKQGIPLYVHSALRTEAEQTALVAAGRSRAAYPRSAHCIGEAVDLVHGTLHWDMSPQEWAFVHALGLRALDRINAPLKVSDKLSLTWGGSWKTFPDPAHWEVTDFRARIKRLPLGPPLRYTPRRILSELRL